jgi:uncharacterized metal-binding protein
VITVVSGGLLAPVAYLTFLGQELSAETSRLDTGLLFGAHLLSGIMFSPDLDIDSAIDNRWGVFFWIWRPYMWAVPHRSRWLSHGLIIPPLLRLGYLVVVLTMGFLGLAWGLGQLGIVVPNYHEQAAQYLLHLARTHPREVLLVLLGFITGGAAHSLADWLVTGGKRWLRRVGLRVTRDYTGHDQARRYPRQRDRRFG